ncbi:MAG: hypothetical protein N2053_09775, partial [Chitinispirillaceae bacterium]|nr:hypothetical protein [Chitinispirillaceae bacterium]
MTQFEIIFIVTIVITGSALILSISGSILLGRLSSKLLLIEKEIDKKSAEIDAIRKSLTKVQKTSESELQQVEQYTPMA